MIVGREQISSFVDRTGLAWLRALGFLALTSQRTLLYAGGEDWPLGLLRDPYAYVRTARPVWRSRVTPVATVALTAADASAGAGKARCAVRSTTAAARVGSPPSSGP